MIDLGFAADEGPEHPHRVLQRKPCGGIASGGIEFQAITHDARIEHQRIDLGVAQLGQPRGIKTEQDLPIMLAFA